MKKFESVQMNNKNPKWENVISREKKLYSPTFGTDTMRSELDRDYTRIINCNAYRRLKNKTQVFFAPDDDHICTRIEHVNLVESISYTIANYLGLNVELTKAISVGHDLGHTPFGHQGEKILNEISVREGLEKFWHGKNGLELVDNFELLRDTEGLKRNLSLCYGVRDGIISHCGSFPKKGLKPRDEFIDLNNFLKSAEYMPYTWEGCIVKIADNISYIGRDIEDAITVNVVKREEIPEFPAKVLGDNNSKIVDTLIKDIIINSFDKPYLEFSEEVFNSLMELKDWNYEKIYNSKKANVNYDHIENITKELYRYYLNRLKYVNYEEELQKEYITSSEKTFYTFVNKMMHKEEKQDIKRIVVDYIAGQTDKFFLNECGLYLE